MPDNLTPKQRSYCMSRIKGKDTWLELRMRSALQKKGLRFRKNVKELPGKPDIVFYKERVVIFLDGDFWHGYPFPSWQNKVSNFWKLKILGNRVRDNKNHRKLRQMGWTVVRIWEHQVQKDFEPSVERITLIVKGKIKKKKSSFGSS